MKAKNLVDLKNQNKNKEPSQSEESSESKESSLSEESRKSGESSLSEEASNSNKSLDKSLETTFKTEQTVIPNVYSPIIGKFSL